jgi:hypothetical protein
MKKRNVDKRKIIGKLKTKQTTTRNYVKFPPEEIFQSVKDKYNYQESNWKKGIKTSFPFKSTYFAGTDKNIAKTPKVGTRV